MKVSVCDKSKLILGYVCMKGEIQVAINIGVHCFQSHPGCKHSTIVCRSDLLHFNCSDRSSPAPTKETRSCSSLKSNYVVMISPLSPGIVVLAVQSSFRVLTRNPNLVCNGHRPLMGEQRKRCRWSFYFHLMIWNRQDQINHKKKKQTRTLKKNSYIPWRYCEWCLLM